MNILGFIPARGGSKGIPRKNLLKIGDDTLIELAVKSSKESKLLTKTIFSSDDDEMIEVAKAAGCEAPFKRPSDLATDKASNNSALKHTINWLQEKDNWHPDIVVILQPTTPFRRGHHIDGTINILLNSKSDAAITVTKFGYPPYWSLKMDNNNRLKNIIKDGNLYTTRQETPQAYRPAGLAYSLKTDFLYKLNTLLPSGDTRGYMVDSMYSINIDTWADYEYAKLIWKNQKFQSL